MTPLRLMTIERHDWRVAPRSADACDLLHKVERERIDGVAPICWDLETDRTSAASRRCRWRGRRALHELVANGIREKLAAASSPKSPHPWLRQRAERPRRSAADFVIQRPAQIAQLAHPSCRRIQP